MASSSQMKSVDRALDVLILLARRSRPMPAKDIAEALSLPKSTAHHLLNVMLERRFVAYSPDQRVWALGVASFEVGVSYMRSGQVVQEAHPYLLALTRATGATSHLAVLQHTDVIYLDKREPHEVAVRLVTDIGARLPAHLTAVGQALLSQLPEAELRNLYDGFLWHSRTGAGPHSLTDLCRVLDDVRGRGYALEQGATTASINCVAAPVTTRDGSAIAALGIAYVTGTMADTELRQAVDRVLELAGKFSASFG